jgi:hypothetical protein
VHEDEWLDERVERMARALAAAQRQLEWERTHPHVSEVVDRLRGALAATELDFEVRPAGDAGLVFVGADDDQVVVLVEERGTVTAWLLRNGRIVDWTVGAVDALDEIVAACWALE